MLKRQDRFFYSPYFFVIFSMLNFQHTIYHKEKHTYLLAQPWLKYFYSSFILNGFFYLDTFNFRTKYIAFVESAASSFLIIILHGINFYLIFNLLCRLSSHFHSRPNTRVIFLSCLTCMPLYYKTIFIPEAFSLIAGFTVYLCCLMFMISRKTKLLFLFSIILFSMSNLLSFLLIMHLYVIFIYRSDFVLSQKTLLGVLVFISAFCFLTTQNLSLESNLIEKIFISTERFHAIQYLQMIVFFFIFPYYLVQKKNFDFVVFTQLFIITSLAVIQLLNFKLSHLYNFQLEQLSYFFILPITFLVYIYLKRINYYFILIFVFASFTWSTYSLLKYENPRYISLTNFKLSSADLMTNEEILDFQANKNTNQSYANTLWDLQNIYTFSYGLRMKNIDVRE